MNRIMQIYGLTPLTDNYSCKPRARRPGKLLTKIIECQFQRTLYGIEIGPNTTR